MEFKPGMRVRHPTKPEWGVGQVLTVANKIIKIFFKTDSEREFRTLDTGTVKLELVPNHPDSVLDHLPPFLGDGFGSKSPKVTLEDGLGRFDQFFPTGFRDPEYLGSSKAGAGEAGERNYKVAAHDLYVRTLAGGQAERWLQEEKIEEVTDRMLKVVDSTNLVSPFEKMALHDGLQDPGKAKGFLEALLAFVADPTPVQFDAAADALLELPVEKGKARVATWPVLTILPFLADPDRFMFMKPEPTKECADRLRFNLQYSSELRWVTYQKLMKMSEMLLEALRSRGAPDFIDVQSFILVIAKY